ncbi:glycoside hydrolase superfamily [Neocallimastix sp. 'constans']|jgi:GH18 family chitinase
MLYKHLSIISLLLITKKVVGNGITGVQIPDNVACNALKLCPIKSEYQEIINNPNQYIGDTINLSDPQYHQCCNQYNQCGETDDYCGPFCQSGGCDPLIANDDEDAPYEGMEWLVKCKNLVMDNKCSNKCPCESGTCNLDTGICEGADAVISNANDCDAMPYGTCSKDCPCKNGMCCSSYGYCGDNENYCGIGCVSGPCLYAPKPANCPNDGSCNADCPCPKGYCCSKYGYCGTGELFCGEGCQNGSCNGGSTAATTVSTTTVPPVVTNTSAITTTSTVAAPSLPTPNDCSSLDIGVCNENCPCKNPDQCCSKYGYCGTGSQYCGAGCVNGPCGDTENNEPVVVPVPITTVSTMKPTTTSIQNVVTTPNATIPTTTTTTYVKPSQTSSTPGAKGKAGVIMYLTNWSIYSRFTNVANYDFSGVDVINYAFFNVDSGGNVLTLDEWADYGWGNGGLIRILTHDIKAKYPNIKVVVSIGGWSCSQYFSDVAASANARKNFARNILNVITTNGFDGVDLDWEYPGGGGLDGNHVRADDAKNFLLMLKDIRNVIGNNYLLTIANSANASIYGEYLIDISKTVDWVGVMTYDMAGAWNAYSGFNSPLYIDKQKDKNGQTSISDVVEDYISKGVEPSQIVIGGAFYGRSWMVTSDENNGAYQLCQQTSWGVQGGVCNAIVGDAFDVSWAPTGVWAYYSLRKQGLLSSSTTANSPWIRKYHELEVCPSIYNYNTKVFIGYDDPKSLKEKTKFARNKGLAGIMVWEISEDYERELLNAMNEGWNN